MFYRIFYYSYINSAFSWCKTVFNNDFILPAVLPAFGVKFPPDDGGIYATETCRS